jgi:glyoxylase-like metal-dependent hydrolase (beta-lactamase superfamily II)
MNCPVHGQAWARGALPQVEHLVGDGEELRVVRPRHGVHAGPSDVPWFETLQELGRFVRKEPWVMAIPSPTHIVAMEMGEFVFPDDEPYAGQRGVAMAYVIRHAGGTILFDTGFGTGNPMLEARYRQKVRRLPDALAGTGVSAADIGAVVNCHLHADHAGQNAFFAGIPIYVQPAEWAAAQDPGYTVREWVDAPGLVYRQVAGDHEIAPGIRILATPGHTAGHQSLVIEAADGNVVIAGQAVYSRDEWMGLSGGREGRSTARDQAAYDRSLARLRALDPVKVLFGHDAEPWEAARP